MSFFNSQCSNNESQAGYTPFFANQSRIKSIFEVGSVKELQESQSAYELFNGSKPEKLSYPFQGNILKNSRVVAYGKDSDLRTSRIQHDSKQINNHHKIESSFAPCKQLQPENRFSSGSHTNSTSKFKNSITNQLIQRQNKFYSKRFNEERNLMRQQHQQQNEKDYLSSAQANQIQIQAKKQKAPGKQSKESCPSKQKLLFPNQQKQVQEKDPTSKIIGSDKYPEKTRFSKIRQTGESYFKIEKSDEIKLPSIKQESLFCRNNDSIFSIKAYQNIANLRKSRVEDAFKSQIIKNKAENQNEKIDYPANLKQKQQRSISGNSSKEDNSTDDFIMKEYLSRQIKNQKSISNKEQINRSNHLQATIQQIKCNSIQNENQKDLKNQQFKIKQKQITISKPNLFSFISKTSNMESKSSDTLNPANITANTTLLASNSKQKTSSNKQAPQTPIKKISRQIQLNQKGPSIGLKQQLKMFGNRPTDRLQLKSVAWTKNGVIKGEKTIQKLPIPTKESLPLPESKQLVKLPFSKEILSKDIQIKQARKSNSSNFLLSTSKKSLFGKHMIELMQLQKDYEKMKQKVNIQKSSYRELAILNDQMNRKIDQALASSSKYL